MSKNATAQKAQETDFVKSHLLVVRPDTGAKLQEKAEDVNSEPIDQEQPKEATPIAPEQPTQPTIEDIKRKAEKLTKLSRKYDDLIDKLHKVEDFVISHDHETASVKVRDAMNFTFESNSPKTIGKLIEFWKEEFTEAIAQVEKEMREIA